MLTSGMHDPNDPVVRIRRKPHGGASANPIVFGRRAGSPLERKRRRMARRKNKIAAMSRRKNRR